MVTLHDQVNKFGLIINAEEEPVCSVNGEGDVWFDPTTELWSKCDGLGNWLPLASPGIGAAFDLQFTNNGSTDGTWTLVQSIGFAGTLTGAVFQTLSGVGDFIVNLNGVPTALTGSVTSTEGTTGVVSVPVVIGDRLTIDITGTDANTVNLGITINGLRLIV